MLAALQRQSDARRDENDNRKFRCNSDSIPLQNLHTRITNLNLNIRDGLKSKASPGRSEPEDEAGWRDDHRIAVPGEHEDGDFVEAVCDPERSRPSADVNRWTAGIGLRLR